MMLAVGKHDFLKGFISIVCVTMCVCVCGCVCGDGRGGGVCLGVRGQAKSSSCAHTAQCNGGIPVTRAVWRSASSVVHLIVLHCAQMCGTR